MRQKYVITKNDEKNEFILAEYAELDKDIMSLLCEQKYDRDKIKNAVEQGKEALITALRTINMYPPVVYLDKIADAVISLCESEDKFSETLFFDDIDLVKEEISEDEVEEDIPDEASTIDDILVDDAPIENDFEGDDDLPTVTPTTSIKVADDDTIDLSIEDD